MAVGILILLFIAAIFMPKSKLLYWIILSYMWLLFSLNTGAPDTSIYEWIYYDNIPDAFEPLFTALMMVCKAMHFSFISFRMIVASLLLIFLNLTFKKIEEYKTLAIAMYMIAPFPWQISGMRAALSCVIVMYALSVLIENPGKNTKKYCFFLLVATLIHYSSILFAVMLFVKNVKKESTRKRMITYILIAVIGTLIVQHTDILFYVVSKFTSREKILTWLSGGPGKEGYPNWKGFTAELIILFGNIILTIKSKAIVSRHDLTGDRAKIAKIICDLNIMMIFFIPLLRLNDTYMRLLLVMHGVNIVLYTMTALILQENGETQKNKRSVWIITPKLRLSLYVLIVPLWTYLIALYQTLPYLGTTESVFEFLNRNIMFY